MEMEYPFHRLGVRSWKTHCRNSMNKIRSMSGFTMSFSYSDPSVGRSSSRYHLDKFSQSNSVLNTIQFGFQSLRILTRHRKNLPAVYSLDKLRIKYYKYDELHNIHGPAFIDHKKNVFGWWLNNIKYTRGDYILEVLRESQKMKWKETTNTCIQLKTLKVGNGHM